MGARSPRQAARCASKLERFDEHPHFSAAPRSFFCVQWAWPLSLPASHQKKEYSSTILKFFHCLVDSLVDLLGSENDPHASLIWSHETAIMEREQFGDRFRLTSKKKKLSLSHWSLLMYFYLRQWVK